MPNGTYGGVRGRKTKVGRKLSFSSYSIILTLSYYFNGSQYEGYIMIPIVDDFVQKFNLGKDFVQTYSKYTHHSMMKYFP